MTSPFGPMTLIVNPRSGRGGAGSALPSIRAVLDDEELEYEIVQTERPWHAAELASDALDRGRKFIVAVGGDGTIHEVVNGMMGADGPVDPDAVLGLVPSGSGSDLVRTFGIRQDPVQAARGLAGKTLWGKLDIGRVSFVAPDGASASRWFVNIAEAGIGAQVVLSATKMPRWLGGRAYRLAALRGVATFRPQEASLRMLGRPARGRRDAEMEPCAHAGQVTMVVVANCQFFGGGLRVAPRAIPSDGMLDVLVGEGSKRQALAALRKMPLGRHVPDPTISEYLAETVDVEATDVLHVEADGEYLGTTPARFSLVPAAIPLKV